MTELKIVKGNDFILKVKVTKKVIGGSTAELLPLDAVENLKISLVNVKETVLDTSISSTEVGICYAKASGLQIGTYALQLTGKYHSYNIRSNELSIITIVNNNAQSNVTPGVYEGEDSYNLDTTVTLFTGNAIVVDNLPTEGSINAVSSGGVYDKEKTEETARINADANLQSQIDTKASKTYVDTELAKKQNSGDYATKSEVQIEENARIAGDATLQNNIDTKAAKTYVDTELAKKQSVGDYATNTEVAKKADKTYVDTELNKKQNVGDYALKSEVTPKADKTYVDTELAKKQNSGDYATNTALNAVDTKATQALSGVSEAQSAASSAQTSATNAQTSASNAQASAAQTEAKVEELKTAIENLPDGQAVSAQVAVNTANITDLALEVDEVRGVHETYNVPSNYERLNLNRVYREGEVISSFSGLIGFYFVDENDGVFPVGTLNQDKLPYTLEKDAYKICDYIGGTLVLNEEGEIDKIDGTINNLEVEVASLKDDINGRIDTITYNVSQYTDFLFSRMLPSGSVITKVDNADGYLLKEDGNFFATPISQLILPYTTTENYKGVKENGNGTIVIYSGTNINKKISDFSGDKRIDVIDANSTEYTDFLFNSVLPSGSIITSIDSDGGYFLKEDGNFFTPQMTELVLPYTTTTNFKGIKHNGTYKVVIKSGTKESVSNLQSYSLRQNINIYKNDSELDILKKFIKAFESGNTDVFFEKGTYTFSEIYLYMKNTLGWAWCMGLPIGNNCRYYFNGSTLVSNTPNGDYTFADGSYYPRNILDTQAIGSNLEVHDVVLKLQGEHGTYCIHDEGFGSNIAYTHKYDNVVMHHNGVRCFGCGTGFDATLIFEKCYFMNWYAMGIHGPEYNTNNDAVSLNIIINSSYSEGCIMGVSPELFNHDRDNINVRVTNNKSIDGITQDTITLAKSIIEFNNKVGNN